MTTMRKLIITFGILAIVLAPVFVPVAAGKPIFEDTKAVTAFGDRVAGFIYNLALVVGIIAILYGAFRYMSAAGDAAQIAEAKKVVTYAIVGLAIAIIAGGVPALISDILEPGA